MFDTEVSSLTKEAVEQPIGFFFAKTNPKVIVVLRVMTYNSI